jgi:hypothetical protein
MSSQLCNGLAAGENLSTSSKGPILQLGNIVPGLFTPVLAKHSNPNLLNPQFSSAPEPIDVFMVPAGWWSDGTADPVK